MSIDINGIAHLRINVFNFEAAKIFYKKLFDFFKMTIIFESDDVIYAVGGRTGLCVSKVHEGNQKCSIKIMWDYTIFAFVQEVLLTSIYVTNF